MKDSSLVAKTRREFKVLAYITNQPLFQHFWNQTAAFLASPGQGLRESGRRWRKVGFRGKWRSEEEM